ncbi:MAG: hypothetical protein MUE44_04290 [Oscillatoriaceae cyanobacterium Prado104]|jgi:hypothetical protein|nr:hypothetical protein [Oscillatoriaceae cyanobacterium Prado104]
MGAIGTARSNRTIETVCIETSILGYLTARSPDNLILAANIKITLPDVSSILNHHLADRPLLFLSNGDRSGVWMRSLFTFFIDRRSHSCTRS